MIRISINDQFIEVPEGWTVLQAAESVGVAIPTLCYHKDLSPFGGCRMCVVQVRGARLPMTSCNLPVSPELEVRTDSEKIIQYRRAVLRMLLVNYYDAGYTRVNGHTGLDEDSELARWCREYGVDIRARMARKPSHPVDSDPNPFVFVDMNKCIQCTRCVRACAEIQGRFVWSQAFRGYRARIVAGADTTMLQARCESCGACVAYCPTGALNNKPSVSAGLADRKVTTTCAYCSVGCRLDLNIKDDVPGGRVIRVTSYHGSEPSFNGMHLCVKGRYGYDFVRHPSRITAPRVRRWVLEGSPRPLDRGPWVEVDWGTALEAASRGLRAARDESGEGGVGVLASGKLLNEENYLLNKFARQVLRTNHIDLCTHIYRSAVTDGLQESTGITAMNGTFAELVDKAQAALVVGGNLTETHPVLGARLRQAVLRRKLKLVVINPDFTNLAEFAALALYPHPGTENALINGLMHVILRHGWEDKAVLEQHLDDFVELKAVIDQYSPLRVAEITGISEPDLVQAAEILAKNRPAAAVWSTGLADRLVGPGNVQSLVNFQLLTGNLDVVGGGIYPLPAQNNELGASDMGARPMWLPGYQRLDDPQPRAAFQAAWGVSLPTAEGYQAPEILASAGAGHIRALYILGEEIINTTAEAARVRSDLLACRFIILQTTAETETERYADVLVPGAVFAEKDGTFTSAERRIQPVQAAIDPVGAARPDWQIITDLARRLQETPVLPGSFTAWDYPDTAAILDEIAALTPIYSGVSRSSLTNREPLFWPVTAPPDYGTKRLETHRPRFVISQPPAVGAAEMEKAGG